MADSTGPLPHLPDATPEPRPQPGPAHSLWPTAAEERPNLAGTTGLSNIDSPPGPRPPGEAVSAPGPGAVDRDAVPPTHEPHLARAETTTRIPEAPLRPVRAPGLRAPVGPGVAPAGDAARPAAEARRIVRVDPPDAFREYLASRGESRGEVPAGGEEGADGATVSGAGLGGTLSRLWTRDVDGVAEGASGGASSRGVGVPEPAAGALRWRVRGLALGVLMLLGILSARLWWLHDRHGVALQGLASRQRVQREPVAPRPGDILDRQGLVLATSIETRSLFVSPRKLADLDVAARELAGVLQLDQASLLTRLQQQRTKGFLWIKRRLEDSEVEAIRRLGWPRDWWGLQSEFRRQHPQGTTAAHVLGQRDIDGRGRGGVEVVFDKRLKGEPGEQSLVLDARGKVLRVEPTPGREVRHGTPLRLTIDTYLQWQAEELLDGVVSQWRPLSACAVVLDPWTGEVLAMASRPTYDPDQAELARADAWTNRAIHDQYEPGSTFKPLVVAWGLERGVVQRSEQFDCENGEWRMGGRVLHDHHRYGMLDVAGILAKSSNIGMAKIGVRLGNPGLHEAATQFGFGQPTGVELPGEVGGLLRPLKKWTRYSTGSIPMGQELSATPLQMAAGFGVLAADGVWMPPHLELDRAGGVTPRRVITAETAQWLREGPLVDVVTKGTGKKAAIPGYAVFGKTGTAQKLDPVTGGYSRSLHVSSFVCGAPAKKPRAVVLVSVDQPSVSVNGEHFGGSVAAPAAGQLLAKVLEYYKVPRDTPASPGPASRGVAGEENADRDRR